jgi:hypothetical protein
MSKRLPTVAADDDEETGTPLMKLSRITGNIYIYIKFNNLKIKYCNKVYQF